MATAISGVTDSIWESTKRPPFVRVINAVGSGLKRVGIRWPRITVDGLMAASKKQTGLSDFGAGSFGAGLEVLVDSFNACEEVHSFGRIFFRNFVTNLLTNRLKIEADIARHPEILEVPIERPIFITGLPRSGTTFLHRLMSEDPAGRTLLYWETIFPSPPPEPETYRTDPRIAQVRRRVELLSRLSPRLATAHELGAEVPEEDNIFYAHDFRSRILGFLYDVAAYDNWLSGNELVGLHSYARRQMQHLSWKHRGDYWILKAPVHLFWLPELLAAFPDASVIITHRDPCQVIPSLCSLAAGFRGILTNRLDLHRLGKEYVEGLPTACQRSIAAREKIDSSRLFDVSYEKLVADPIATVRAACDHFGYKFTPEYETRARRYIAENPKHKLGAHQYRLQDFGLNEETVKHNFADYLTWVMGRELVKGY